MAYLVPGSPRCSRTSCQSVRIVPGSGRFSRAPPASRLGGSGVQAGPSVPGGRLRLQPRCSSSSSRSRRRRGEQRHGPGSSGSLLLLFLSLLKKKVKTVGPNGSTWYLKSDIPQATCVLRLWCVPPFCLFPPLSPVAVGWRSDGVFTWPLVHLLLRSGVSLEPRGRIRDSLHEPVDTAACTGLLVPHIIGEEMGICMGLHFVLCSMEKS